MSDHHETDFDELGGGPETGNEYPSELPDLLQDDVPTSPHHDIPSFVGLAPSTIPGAPDWANKVIQRIDDHEAGLVLAMNELTDLARQMRDHNDANSAMLKGAIDGLRGEVRSRLTNHDTELDELRAELATLKGQVLAIEAKLSALETAEP